MGKKKHQDSDNYLDFQQDSEPSVPEEEALDEEEESEEGESEDVFAEDESDIAMMRKLEEDDAQRALSAIVIEEEIGFKPTYDWSTLPDSELNRFSALKNADKAEIENYSWKNLSAMKRWMVGLACIRHGLHEMFREIANSIIKLRKAPPELCLEDIYLELVRDYTETKEYDQAFKMLDKFEKTYPQEAFAAMRVRGLIYYDMGDNEKGKEAIDKVIKWRFNQDIEAFKGDRSGGFLAQRDGVVQYEVGYALLNMKHYELAREYFERAQSLAKMNDNYDLMMAIDDALAVTLRQLSGDEPMF
ncbi:MAG: hypothetical protein IKY83_03030 [Proteobacteria bacterium]|nr:hypothetical protein [Pseudomonadota bacterium]